MRSDAPLRILLPTAAALGSLFVVAFQLQLVPFFAHLFVEDRLLWPIVFYGIWAFVIGVTLVLLFLQDSVRRQSLPVLAVCASAMLLTLIHPIDGVAKNFFVAVTFVACISVLATASTPFALLRFSATATLLSAVICLLDILFSHGFTNTVGRAAGLSINANVAAAGLLLGAASSFWTVPQRWRSPFLLIVGAAIFVTLSRSTLLAAILICAGIAADLLWNRMRSPQPHSRIRWLASGATVLALAGWIAVALVSNDRFSVAARSSFLQIGAVQTQFAEAREAIANSIRAQTPPSPVDAVPRREPGPPSKTTPLSTTTSPSKTAPSKTATTSPSDAPRQSAPASPSSGPVPQSSRPAPSPDATPRPTPQPSGDDNERKLKTEEIIREITRRAEHEGDINSISARGLLMERAWLSYRSGPFFGRGLATAHALQPHNTFLLFAVAFGDFGWFVPLAFLGLTAYSVRSVQQLPLCLATFTVMMTSHDLPFTFGLLAPYILGIVGLNARLHGIQDKPGAVPAIRYAAAAAPFLFVIGAVATRGVGPSSIAGAPRLLVYFVFCVIALWAAVIWRWHQELLPRDHVLPGGREWD
ncbi:MAG: hypothetical protein JWR80_1628 [Bradyrhizobium sp.]|nr:hypothetical protein [Bradyrhizobium sp.]